MWVPRYVYKIDTTQTERMDVKFVNLDNDYIDGVTEVKTAWADLQAAGYEIPEAFTWTDGTTTTELTGYWISKYQLSV